MSKLIRGSLILSAACLLASGCGSDRKSTDASVPSSDRGNITIPDGGGTTPDQGVAPADQGQTTPLSCIKLVQCLNDCAGNADCRTGCLAKGTAEAQQQVEALMKCYDAAISGDCAASCTDPSAQACQDCVQPACKAELDACAGTGGPPVQGFGDACDPAAQPTTCPAGLECKPVSAPEKGFCTKACTNPGEACAGAAEGQLAACILGYEGDPATYCAFLCELKDSGGATQTFQCPSTLTCGEEDPPNSGQKGCDP